MPDSNDVLGPFYQDVVAADHLEPWGATSARYRLQVLAPTLAFPTGSARLVPSNNNDVWRVELDFSGWHGGAIEAASPGKPSSWKDSAGISLSPRSWTAAKAVGWPGH